MRDNLCHGLIEFVVTYDVIMVAVNFCHDLVPELIIALLKSYLAERTIKYGSKLLLANNSVLINIEKVKSDSQIPGVQKLGTIDRCSDKFTVVDLTIMVRIELVDQVVPVLRASTHDSQDLSHAYLQLFEREEAVLRSVKPEKHFLHVQQFV